MPCTFFENWAHAKIKYLLPVCQILQKFTEGNARKCTVSFSFCAHVDAIKYWKTLADVFLRTWRITCAFILRVCVMAKLQGARNFWFSCKSQLKVNTLEMLDFGLERFSIECRKTKTKVITVANQRGHRQSSGPIKTRGNYMKLTQSAGKRVRVSQDWFWFYFWLDENVARVFLSQSCGAQNAKPIAFRHSNENRSNVFVG